MTVTVKELPTTGDSIPEFQLILCVDKNDLDHRYALIRHMGSGKVYDSRDCRLIELDPETCKQIVSGFWAMWVDQGKPQTDFYFDQSDAPNYVR